MGIVSSNAIVLGPVLPPGTPLEFAAPAVFIGLLVPQVTGAVSRRVALTAAAVAAAASALPSGSGLLVGVAAGLAVGLLSERRSS